MVDREACPGLFRALDERFDNLDELKDIARHGCDGGVSGFIYDHELREFFFTYEDEIESIMINTDTMYSDLVDEGGIQDYITQAVWYIVGYYAQHCIHLDECMVLDGHTSMYAY